MKYSKFSMMVFSTTSSLNIKMKNKQVIANKSPAVARTIYTTERGKASVTVSAIGIPSVGIPSGIGA